MTYVCKTLEAMLAEIGGREIVREESLSLADTPEWFELRKTTMPKKEIEAAGLPFLPPQYKPEHIRMGENWEETFSVTEMQTIKHDLYIELADACGLRDTTWVNPHTGKEVIVENWIVVMEVMQNAFRWGNRFDPSLAINIKIYKGDKGTILRVEDSGVGFDFKKVVAACRQGTKYARRGGKGTVRLMADSVYELAYEGSGSIVNILSLNQKDSE